MNLDEAVEKCETIEDLIGKNGLIQKLVGGMVEKLLEKEMEDHLGYEKPSSKGKSSGNSWNGKTKKTVHGSHGDLKIDVPRDSNIEGA